MMCVEASWIKLYLWNKPFFSYVCFIWVNIWFLCLLNMHDNLSCHIIFFTYFNYIWALFNDKLSTLINILVGKKRWYVGWIQPQSPRYLLECWNKNWEWEINSIPSRYYDWMFQKMRRGIKKFIIILFRYKINSSMLYDITISLWLLSYFYSYFYIPNAPTTSLKKIILGLLFRSITSKFCLIRKNKNENGDKS